MIIYSGEHLIAHWNEGSTDYLLVTFDQLNGEHFAFQQYFLKTQVVPADISCVGVMTRERNFYLSPEMTQVAAAVAEKRAGRKVVVFGQSVGAYAALKFSALLGADAVIALSPIYSLRAKDLDFTEERHHRVLSHALNQYSIKDRPEFDTMAIRPEETSGRLLVIYDPAEAIDAFSAETIANRLPGSELFMVSHAGHTIYDAGWESALITDLIGAALSNDSDRIGRTVTHMRRHSLPFLVRALTKAANRKPQLFVAAMSARRVRSHTHYRDLIGAPFNLRALVLLSEQGRHAIAAAHLAKIMREYYAIDIKPAVWEPGADAGDMLRRYRCLLLSTHGTFLCWHAEDGYARFEPHPFRLEIRLPIVARLQNGCATFRAVTEGVETAIAMFAPEPDATTPAPVEIELLDKQHVAIRSGDRYLGATPDGGPQLLPSIGHQQRMIVLPLDDDSALFRRTASTWFTQAMVNQAVQPEAVKVVQRAAPRWRGLFNRR